MSWRSICLASAILSGICHLLLEETVWPQGSTQWLAVLALGLFPVGAAFYTWDLGVKRGDIMVLGAMSYASPLLSTLILLAAGYAAAHWSVAVACLLITAGAIVAAKDMLFRRKRRKPRRRQLKAFEPEPRRHRAADQGPAAEGHGHLPVMLGHDDLRPLAFSERGPENLRLSSFFRLATA